MERSRLERGFLHEFADVSRECDEFRKSKVMYGGSSAVDILNNVLTRSHSVNQLLNLGIKLDEEGQKLIPESLTELRAIRKYLFLMKEYPAFSSKERLGNLEQKRECAFPHIKRLFDDQAKKMGYLTPNHAYIEMSAEILENKRGYLLK